MKDSLFEILMHLFEKTLTKIKEDQQIEKESQKVREAEQEDELLTEFVRSASESSMRVLTYDEQMKLTKASYQFLMRLLRWDIINKDQLEMILDQLIFSEQRIVVLEETKLTVRDVLENILEPEQLALLDLVLYQQDNAYTMH